jgi:uncharacterized repeat protein (TIGR01451 family)
VAVAQLWIVSLLRTMQNITLITAIAGLVFGVLGAVLGVINTWRAITHDKLRVRVNPVSRIRADTGEEIGFGIEVTNLSRLPVTIDMVGFDTIDKGIFLTWADITGCQLPQRMEPRTSFTAILPIRTEHDGWSRIVCAFAQTACGQRFTGTSPVLRAKIAAARKKV